VKIETTRFGEIEIDEGKILFFTTGILGFPQAKRYVLIPHRENSPFMWLQAVDVPELAFVVIMPRLFFPEYQPQIPYEAREELHLHKGDEMDLLAIVTIPREAPDHPPWYSIILIALRSSSSPLFCKNCLIILLAFSVTSNIRVSSSR